MSEDINGRKINLLIACIFNSFITNDTFLTPISPQETSTITQVLPEPQLQES
jgi:hypothetical protein